MSELTDAGKELKRIASFEVMSDEDVDFLISAVRTYDSERARALSRRGYSAQEIADRIDPRKKPRAPHRFVGKEYEPCSGCGYSESSEGHIGLDS